MKYAEDNFDTDLYFVKDSKKIYWSKNEKYVNNDVYNVLKVHDGKIEEIEINKGNMPKNIGVNDAFRLKDGLFCIDDLASEQLQESITNMAEEIIDKQNLKLEEYRKEGHLYMVTEELNNNRFLYDLTDKSKTEFEEVEISKDVLEKATEGVVLKYTNGQYEYYSNDGFERLEKMS